MININNSNIKRRKTIRLKEYNYSNNGMYFITICTNNRKEILAKIKNVGGHGVPCPQIKIELTKIGEIVRNEIKKTNIIRGDVEINEYIIMPNHIHMLIEINKKGTVPCAPTIEKFGNPTSKTILTIIRYIKGGVTRTYRKQHKSDTNIWQRNYYEHIVRNEKELIEIIKYIRNNPINWKKDYLNNKNEP